GRPGPGRGSPTCRDRTAGRAATLRRRAKHGMPFPGQPGPMQVVTSHAGVRSILTDPAWVVPPAQPDGTTGTLAWLRASVPRFCSGPDHERRRALAEREL